MEKAGAIDEVVQDAFGEDSDSITIVPQSISVSAKNVLVLDNLSQETVPRADNSDDECLLVHWRECVRQHLTKGKSSVSFVEPLVEGAPGSLPDRVAKVFAEVEANIVVEELLDNVVPSVPKKVTPTQATKNKVDDQLISRRMTRSSANQQFADMCKPKKPRLSRKLSR